MAKTTQGWKELAQELSMIQATANSSVYLLEEEAPPPLNLLSAANSLQSSVSTVTVTSTSFSSSELALLGGNEEQDSSRCNIFNILDWLQRKEEAKGFVEGKIKHQQEMIARMDSLIERAEKFADLRRNSFNEIAGVVSNRKIQKCKTQVELAERAIGDFNQLICDIECGDDVIDYVRVSNEILRKSTTPQLAAMDSFSSHHNSLREDSGHDCLMSRETSDSSSEHFRRELCEI